MKNEQPAYVRVSPVNIKGTQTNRLMIVFRTNGCEYAKKTGGCSMCGFKNHASPTVTEKQIKTQLKNTIKKIKDEKGFSDIKEIDVLTLGSFFNDHETSQELRDYIFKEISKIKTVKRVTTESRAEYFTVEKIKKSKNILKNKIFEIGIGLESSDDYIRNKIVRKGLSKISFENVVKKIKEGGADLLVYLLIKPPGLTEKEAIVICTPKSGHNVSLFCNLN